MIVSIAIFTVVALVAVGALLKVVDANKKAQSLKTSINNLNFALDSISREMRVGSNYRPSGTFSSDPWTVYFESSKPSPTAGCNLTFAYRFEGGTLKKAEATLCNVDPSNFAPLISSDIKFDNGGIASVKVVNESNVQSYAQFHFRGYAGVKEKTKTYFDLQTMVSQRLED